MIIAPDRSEYIVCVTPVLKAGKYNHYRCELVKKDVPEDILADMRRIDQYWREDHNNRPCYIFPDDPKYDEYLEMSLKK